MQRVLHKRAWPRWLLAGVAAIVASMALWVASGGSVSPASASSNLTGPGLAGLVAEPSTDEGGGDGGPINRPAQGVPLPKATEPGELPTGPATVGCYSDIVRPDETQVAVVRTFGNDPLEVCSKLWAAGELVGPLPASLTGCKNDQGFPVILPDRSGSCAANGFTDAS